MDPSWRPAATPRGLAARAATLRAIREFFAQRGVMEVETPLLGHAAVPDEATRPLGCGGMFLSTSPEPAMKRLLATGCGPIYQITRAFRDEELGSLHNPEFTMLEWYRPGWNWEALAREAVELMQTVLGPGPVHEFTYAQLFRNWAGVDAYNDPEARLAAMLEGPVPSGLDRWGLLDLLLVQRVEPVLRTLDGVVMVTRFPAERAAMAVIDPGPPPTARRFELYARGVELVNGYQELTDWQEQAARFEHANRRLEAEGRSPLPVDRNFLAALRAGLPECAGAALGVDRLVMLSVGATSLGEVLAFPFDRA
ncbi:MAG: EF-P lysine aminoacylase GenX [Magnetococcales bacterium]|nr:EF-P lysine aminoacylase GenX [Magnetococcales bacterium]